MQLSLAHQRTVKRSLQCYPGQKFNVAAAVAIDGATSALSHAYHPHQYRLHKHLGRGASETSLVQL